jgi:histidinol phosphatase-like enzyme
LDLGESFLIGDKLSDLQCGWNAGVKKSILVRTGYGRRVEHDSPNEIARAAVVDNLDGAASFILRK